MPSFIHIPIRNDRLFIKINANNFVLSVICSNFAAAKIRNKKILYHKKISLETHENR